MLLAAAVVLGAALVVGLAGVPRSEQFALSPQECNTECQTRQTDCVDACDGNVACERRCVEAGFACLARCKGLGADAGVGGAGGAGGKGGSSGKGGKGGSGTGGAAGAPGPAAGAGGRGGASP